MVKIEKIDTWEAWVVIRDQWNEILEKNELQVPFLTFEWLTTWWTAFKDQRTRSQLYILVIYEDDVIVGLAPLMNWLTKNSLFPIRKITFLANEYSNRIDFIIPTEKKEYYHQIWDYLLQHSGEWDEIELNYLPTHSTTIHQLEHNEQMKVIKHDLFDSPYLTIQQDWDSFFSAKSRNLRTTLKKKWNRLARLGSLTVKQVTQIEEGKAVLEKLFNVASRSWKAKQGTAISSSSELRLFYTQFAHLASLKKWLSLWILMLDEKPIAFSYNLRYQDTEYSLKSYYDPEYYLLSPGRLLIWQILQAVFNDKTIRKYDFLGVPEPYKAEWANQPTPHSIVFLYHSGLYSTILYRWKWFFSQLNSIKKSVGKQLPWLKRFHRSYKRIWQHINSQKEIICTIVFLIC